MAIMEGSDPKKKIESTYWNALSKNWMLWPFVQAINFKFVPLMHRVLVVNVVSLGMFSCQFSFLPRTNTHSGWNCYLSYLNSTGAAIPKELPPS
jgi:protein Mpv17